jgi:hypothetical protein
MANAFRVTASISRAENSAGTMQPRRMPDRTRGSCRFRIRSPEDDYFEITSV